MHIIVRQNRICANIVNNYTKSKFSTIFPVCSFKYISPQKYIFAVSDGYDRYLAYLKDYVGGNEYKKAKRGKVRLIKSMHPFLYGKYEKELKERFVEEIAKVHDYKRAVKPKKV